MLNSSDTALLRTQAKLLNTARDRKGQLEIFNGLPHAEDLKGDPILCRDGSNSNVGIVLTPHDGLMQAVELRKGERSVFLLPSTIFFSSSPSLYASSLVFNVGGCLGTALGVFRKR